jgi:putative FmdB family regulatory protein
VPTYDYACRTCGNRLEVIHAMTAEGPSACTQCGGELRRILFPAGIIFKGSGFYKTDSRKGDAHTNTAGSSPSGSSKASSEGGPSTTERSGGEQAKPKTQSSPAADAGGGATS